MKKNRERPGTESIGICPASGLGSRQLLAGFFRDQISVTSAKCLDGRVGNQSQYDLVYKSIQGKKNLVFGETEVRPSGRQWVGGWMGWCVGYGVGSAVGDRKVTPPDDSLRFPVPRRLTMPNLGGRIIRE